MVLRDEIEWVAVDWGTSRLRVFAIGENGNIINDKINDNGMGKLSPDKFEDKLLELISDWLKDGEVMPVVACGMVGSRQGWCEAPYRYLPCDNMVGQLVSPQVNDKRIEVYIIPGIAQKSPVDVMRGEETQIAGFLKDNKNYNGVLCLPGTHSKWIKIVDGKVESFKTAMTGEVFSLISKQSILRFSMESNKIDNSVFCKALDDINANPEDLLSKLFSVRSRDLINRDEVGNGYSILSAYLIGLDVISAKSLINASNLCFLGDERLSALYQLAAIYFGLVDEGKVKIVNVNKMTLSGLEYAYQTYVK